MARPSSPDLMKDWKLSLPATIAGAVEHELMDPITKKPRYGERSKLATYLLASWLEQRRGRKFDIDLPAPDLLEQPQ